MAGLDIVMVNGIRPCAGSGDGITEYAYQMYRQLATRNRVGLVYSIERPRRNDAVGLIRINSMLGRRARSAASTKHDIFHIVNQEVGFAARDIKRRNPKNRVITTIHDISRFEKGLHRGRLQSAFSVMVRRSVTKAVENSDFLIFNSEQTMEEVRKRFRVRRGAVVNIGIGNEFRTKKSAGKSSGFSVGYIGSFAYHKNVVMALEAANALKKGNIHFQIYGTGMERDNLSAYAHAHRLNNLRLMGFAPEHGKVHIYDSFSAFVFPSMYEGFGLPIIEAQARGLPVIIYKYGNISREIRRYCFEAEDAEHMAGIIEEIRDKGYDGKMRRKATEYARSFTWEKCARETESIYRKVAGK
ncbi:glycosyltransferase [Candidatus Marsarchaeota archaeon]|nr:glycosyltransferase [Candidatus Marsarchaeota archaeon]